MRLLVMGLAGKYDLEVIVDSASLAVACVATLCEEQYPMAGQVHELSAEAVRDLFEDGDVQCRVLRDMMEDYTVTPVDVGATVFNGDVRDWKDGSEE